MKQSIKIGRDNSNDIVINEARVSRSHAIVTNLGNGNFEVKDLGSSNGTFVNGTKITILSIRQGDRIQVANCEVNWFEAFVKAQSNDVSMINEEAFSKIKKTISIGTSAHNDIVIESNFVSSQHAKISLLQNGNYYIQDCGSSNGTFINGTKVVAKNFTKTDVVKIATSNLPLNWFQNKKLKTNFFQDNKKTIIISFILLVLIISSTISYINSCKWFQWKCNISAQKVYSQNKNAIVYIEHYYFYTIKFHDTRYYIGRNKTFGIVEANTSKDNLFPYDTITGSGCLIKNDGSILTSSLLIYPWLNISDAKALLNKVVESKTIPNFNLNEKLTICGETFELKFILNGMIFNQQNFIQATAVNNCKVSDSSNVIIKSVKKELPPNSSIINYSFNSESINPLNQTKKYYYSYINAIKNNEIISDTFIAALDTFNINRNISISLNKSLPKLKEGSTVFNERGELVGWVQKNKTHYIHTIFNQIKKIKPPSYANSFYW